MKSFLLAILLAFFISGTVQAQDGDRYPQLAKEWSVKSKKKPIHYRTFIASAERNSTIVGSRPIGCPQRFCACALAIEVFGRIIPSLNPAAAWFKFQRVPAASGMVAVRPGHVFKLLTHVNGSTWEVWDANSGGGRIRIHKRSIAGYAIVNPRG